MKTNADETVALCTSEDLRRQGWDAALRAAVCRVHEALGSWEAQGISDEILAIPYDLDEADE